MDNVPEPSMKDFDPSIARAFEELRVFEYPQIQEDRFAREFLPLFAEPSADANTAMIKWLDISGNVFMPVNVFRGKDFIFRVPPLMQQTPFRENNGGPKHSLFEEINTAEKKRMVLPALGEAHMRDYVYSRVDHDLEASVEIARAWNSIFEAYGYEPIPLPGDESTPNADAVETDTAQQVSPGDVEISGYREL